MRKFIGTTELTFENAPHMFMPLPGETTLSSDPSSYVYVGDTKMGWVDERNNVHGLVAIYGAHAVLSQCVESPKTHDAIGAACVEQRGINIVKPERLPLEARRSLAKLVIQNLGVTTDLRSVEWAGIEVPSNIELPEVDMRHFMTRDPKYVAQNRQHAVTLNAIRQQLYRKVSEWEPEEPVDSSQPF